MHGVDLALEFVFPELFHGVPWLVPSRLCQAHTNTVMFAFLSGGMMGLWLYIVPRLTGRRLWSERLGNLTMFLWNVAVLVGIVGLLTAHSQSREYAEFIWAVDVGVVIVLVLNLINLYMASAHRVESKLYVSLRRTALALILWSRRGFLKAADGGSSKGWSRVLTFGSFLSRIAL